MTSTRDHRAAAALSRRSLLLAAGTGVATSACTVTRDAAPVAAPSLATPSVDAPPVTVTVTESVPAPEPTEVEQPTPEPVPSVEAQPPYEILATEVEPACKLAAVRFLEAVFTAADKARDEAGLAARLDGVDQPAPPALTLLDRLPEVGPTALAISYPQYGGLVLADGLASMMVVADQLLLGPPDGATPGQPVRRSLVVDVRLSNIEGRWVVTDALPGRPGPAQPSVTPAVQAVLDDDRIVLPGPARADLLSGLVDDVVAAAMSTLATRWRIGVQVLQSGHPENVFETDRLSAHTIGRAVDIWSIDDVPVIDRERSQWRALMEAGVALGAPQVGGPLDLGPPSGPYFTDLVHQDHVHVGWRTVDATTRLAPPPPG